jgi:hypothetical protein
MAGSSTVSGSYLAWTACLSDSRFMVGMRI